MVEHVSFYFNYFHNTLLSFRQSIFGLGGEHQKDFHNTLLSFRQSIFGLGGEHQKDFHNTLLSFRPCGEI